MAETIKMSNDDKWEIERAAQILQDAEEIKLDKKKMDKVKQYLMKKSTAQANLNKDLGLTEKVQKKLNKINYKQDD